MLQKQYLCRRFRKAPPPLLGRTGRNHPAAGRGGGGQQCPSSTPILAAANNMNIAEILKSEKGALLVVDAKDLKEFANTIAAETAERLEREQADMQITPTQAANMLGVDRSTLWRWGRENYLVPVKVGAKCFYWLSEVKRIKGVRK